MSPVKYELGFYIAEDAILHSHCRENLKSYMEATGCSEFLGLIYHCTASYPNNRVSAQTL
jgi:hypothetical protein